MSLLPFAHLLGLPSKKKANKAGQRPERPGKIATFPHLATRSNGGGRAAMDADDTDAQEPTVPCEFCEGTGRLNGGDCEACDGEGEVTAQQRIDSAADFVKEFRDVQKLTQGKRPADGAATPKRDSFAAEVVAAGRKARGDR